MDRLGRPPTRVAADRAHADDLEGLSGGALRRGLIDSNYRRGADGVRTAGRLWRP